MKNATQSCSKENLLLFFLLILDLYLLKNLKAELHPICHLLTLAGASHFVDLSRIRVKQKKKSQRRQQAFNIYSQK
jgi:hypothetical protein